MLLLRHIPVVTNKTASTSQPGVTGVLGTINLTALMAGTNDENYIFTPSAYIYNRTFSIITLSISAKNNNAYDNYFYRTDYCFVVY